MSMLEYSRKCWDDPEFARKQREEIDRKRAQRGRR